jgi:hypothetical protein
MYSGCPEAGRGGGEKEGKLLFLTLKSVLSWGSRTGKRSQSCLEALRFCLQSLHIDYLPGGENVILTKQT